MKELTMKEIESVSGGNILRFVWYMLKPTKMGDGTIEGGQLYMDTGSACEPFPSDMV